MDKSADAAHIVFALKRRYVAMMDGGVSFPKIRDFAFLCMKRLYKLSQRYDAMTEAERKAFVVGGVRGVYNEINPDIPGIPEFIENPLENYLLGMTIPMAYDMVHALLSADEEDDA